MLFFNFGLPAGFIAFLFAGSLSLAQTASVGFSNDTSQPLEVSADSLMLNQDAGTAVFEGSVKVSQGGFHLEADHVEVFYGQLEDTGANEIIRFVATGKVKLLSGSERAEADSATYNVDDRKIRMQGDVLLTQGRSLISGDTAVIDLADGSARVEGQVRTVLQPGESSE